MIYFDDIFNKAFNIFDDPDISQKYFYDRAGFQKEMREYLLVGKDKFTSPTAITDLLIFYDSPEGYMEIIEGQNTDTYTLDSTPHEHAAFSFKIGEKFVPGRYNSETNSVTFFRPVLADEVCSVVWFYAGAFTADFSGCFRTDFSIDAILNKIKIILAYATLSAWGDKEVGRVLEVRNIMTDHDFRIYSPANSADAKVRWRDKMNENLDTLVSELTWRILSEPKGGSSFGK